jgi:hypothetical protein
VPGVTGMMAMHEGKTYRASAVIQERKWVYLHTDAEIIILSDCVLTLLNGHGEPIQILTTLFNRSAWLTRAAFARTF